MELNNDEVVILSCLLRHCRSKHRYEIGGAEDVIMKVCNESKMIVARKARKKIKPGLWS